MNTINRVWDTVAAGFVFWVTGEPDPTGAAYPGPGTFGAQTSDYCVLRDGQQQPPLEGRLHDRNPTPVFLAQLNGNRDATVGGNLTIGTGTEQYGRGHTSITRAAFFDGATDFRSATPAAALTGDVSYEMIVQPSVYQTVAAILFAYQTSGETEPTNALWSIALEGGTNRLLYIHEYGPGNNELSFFEEVLEPGAWYHLAVTRDATANDVIVYVNGRAVGTFNYTNDATGGGSASVRIGGVTPNFFEGYLSTCKVVAGVLTPAQVMRNAKLTLPIAVRP